MLSKNFGDLARVQLGSVEMASIAREENIKPTRISFVESLRLMRTEWEWLSVASPGAIPKRLATLRRNVKRYILPERRKRSYPRHTKLKINRHNWKKPAAKP